MSAVEVTLFFQQMDPKFLRNQRFAKKHMKLHKVKKVESSEKEKK